MSNQVTLLNILIEASIPVMLEGDPGTAKSAITEGLARSLGRHCEVVLSSLREPADFGGLPDRTPEGVRLLAPGFAHRLAASRRGLLFLDEVTHAAPAVQAALGRVVLDRVVGECDMGLKTSIVLAGNPAESGGCQSIIEMLNNRMARIQWQMPLDVWFDGALSGFADPIGVFLPEGWGAGIATALARIVSFLRKNPALATTSAEAAANMASYPTIRSWTAAARAVAAAQSIGYGPLSEVSADLVRSLVGEAAARSYTVWVQTQDLADPEDVLADPKGFTLPTRGDRVCTLLDSVVAAALSKGTRTDAEISARYAAAWIVLGRVMDAGSKDLAVPAATTLARSRPPFCAVPAEAAKLHSILTAAGLLAK